MLGCETVGAEHTSGATPSLAVHWPMVRNRRRGKNMEARE
jgi:hypothetical protein